MANDELDWDGEEKPAPPPEPANLARTPLSVSQALLLHEDAKRHDVGSVKLEGTRIALLSNGGEEISAASIGAATKDSPGAMSAADKAALDTLAARPWPDAPLNLKGVAPSASELPAEGNKPGDMYIVGASSPYEEHFWTGTAWEMLGTFAGDVDTSGFVVKGDVLSDQEFVEMVINGE